MAFDYEDAGTFESEREAKDWAQRNKVDLRDLHIRNVGGQRVGVRIRKSAFEQREDDDNRHGVDRSAQHGVHSDTLRRISICGVGPVKDAKQLLERRFDGCAALPVLYSAA